MTTSKGKKEAVVKKNPQWSYGGEKKSKRERAKRQESKVARKKKREAAVNGKAKEKSNEWTIRP